MAIVPLMRCRNIMVSALDLDSLAARFRQRGLHTPGNPDAPQEVHEGPLNQSWGRREFYVDDPDGNTVRFTSAAKEPPPRSDGR